MLCVQPTNIDDLPSAQKQCIRTQICIANLSFPSGRGPSGADFWTESWCRTVLHLGGALRPVPGALSAPTGRPHPLWIPKPAIYDPIAIGVVQVRVIRVQRGPTPRLHKYFPGSPGLQHRPLRSPRKGFDLLIKIAPHRAAVKASIECGPP
jgi:hypothetical protein